MLFRKRNPPNPETDAASSTALGVGRRRWLQAAGVAGAAGMGWAGWQWYRQFRGSDEEVIGRGRSPDPPRQAVVEVYPAPSDDRFSYGRTETFEAEAARYTNFYEFSRYKSTWRYVDAFQPSPWKLTVSGLCRRPLTLDLDDFFKRYAASFVERRYRHRCVERWAMAIPWTGIPLARLLKDADPLSEARYVRFVSFNRPDQAPGIAGMPQHPWPYVEGLTLPEARHDLTLLATGMYGHPLLKQHGAPIRLVVPWKYGYKSIKSIERIEFVRERPETFWTTINPQAYPFESNVEPDVPRPWPQQMETMLGSDEVFKTQLYNGYGEHVAQLYRS